MIKEMKLSELIPDEFLFWRKVWDEWNMMRGTKLKSDKAISTWLKDPASDAALYKMWGNGIALPCAKLVLSRMKQVLDSVQTTASMSDNHP